MCLKIKQEASGWPTWCKTEEGKDQYIGRYYEHENIELDKEKIEKYKLIFLILKARLQNFSIFSRIWIRKFVKLKYIP
jgi:hypothetical protein